MSQSITLEKVGQRLYFRGNTFAAKDRIKSLGGHWDGDARGWWVGAKKQGEAEALLRELDAATERNPERRAVLSDQAEESGNDTLAAQLRQPPPAENLDDCRVYAQVEYKGRRYYVIAEQRAPQTHQPLRCRLTTLDSMTPFWADCQACNLIRTYQGREVWDGRCYSGKTRTVYQTIGSMREFRDSQAQARKSGEPVCAECGRAGGELVADLEDGQLKHPRCCDIAP